MKKTLIMATAMTLAAGMASAAVIDIDFETGFAADVTGVGDPYNTGGVTFTRGETQNVVKTGAPQDGFVPNDNITDGVFGDYFLTDDFVSNTTVDLGLTFDETGGVTDLMFYIGDIDGSGGGTETFKAVATLYGGGTTEIEFKSGDAGTGNSAATLFDFSAYRVTSVDIMGTSQGGSRNIGWGIDNISATEVPLPAAAWMLLAGVGGLGAMSARRRKS